jgi:hypothetical protein
MSTSKFYASAKRLIPIKRELFFNAAAKFGLYPSYAKYYHLVDIDTWLAVGPTISRLSSDAYDEVDRVATARRIAKVSL